MAERQYKDLKLRLFKSLSEFEAAEDLTFHWCNSDGEDLGLKTEDIDTSDALSKQHFADDSTLSSDSFMWEAFTDEPRGIVCSLLSQVDSIDFEEILTTIGHELGHLSDGDSFKNATSSYETPDGYIQEEKKGQAFEYFTLNVFEVTLLYIEMFTELGIKINYGRISERI